MKGLYLVPYRTNTKFHGRSSEINWIQNFFSTRPNSQTLQQRLVLQGLVGIGKTSIAVQYAGSQMGKYEGVFWATAKSKEAVATRYREFDELVKKSTDKTFFEWSVERHWCC